MRQSELLAKQIRAHAVKMVHRARASHIGSCLSMADLLAVLYEDVLKVDPQAPKAHARDRFLLSKGHGVAILYAVLAQKGFFPLEWLEHYCENGNPLAGHATSHGVPGIEVSTGSLGHALPIACGMALALRQDQLSSQVVVIVSDGELDEGSNWEALLFAPQHQLDNLTVIVDYNKIQSFGTVQDVLELEPLRAKFEAFRWNVREIDGHDHQQISEVLSQIPFESGKPNLILAHTVKGKGVSYMEHQLSWHYTPPNDEQLQQALQEIEAS